MKGEKSMKKIIEGAMYNTESARLIGSWNNDFHGNDFRFSFQYLYQTRSGKYFVYGGGGPLSTYAVQRGNQTAGSEQILPLTAEEAREWGEKLLNPETYIKEFGEPEEAAGDKKRKITVTIEEDIYTALQRQKAKSGNTIGEIIEDAIREKYMNHPE